MFTLGKNKSKNIILKVKIIVMTKNKLYYHLKKKFPLL